MEKILFIINPIAGKGKSELCVEIINRLINRKRFDYKIVFTEYASHATELARLAAAENYDVVAAVGGDGTVNEVACGLVGTQTALAIVPHGSGDGLALHLKIPRTVIGGVRVINHGKPFLADSGIVEGHRFFTTTGVGFDAKVAYDYSQAHTRGLITYVEKAIRDWRLFQPANYVITTDTERIETRALLVTVGNANQWGNRCHITPWASITDGLLEISIVKPVRIAETPAMLGKLFRYDAYRSRNILHLQGQHITIERDGGDEAHFDGEAILFPRTIHIDCEPQSINMWR